MIPLNLVTQSQFRRALGGLPALILVGLLAASAAAQTGAIRGKVRSPAGGTLTGVLVELWRQNGLEKQMVTTRDGDFEFVGLVPANYEIVVKVAGFQPANERAEFRVFERTDGRIEDLRIDINLKPLASTDAIGGTRFVQNVPKAAQAAFDAAMVKFREAQPVAAVALLREAISVFPNYFNARYALANQLSRDGKVDEALAELEVARAINDRDAGLYQLFGVLMTSQRKFATAEWAFRAAIDRDPSAAQSYLSRTIVLLELLKLGTDQEKMKAQLTDAEASIARVFELAGDKYPTAYLHRGRIHELRGNGKAAAADLSHYLKLNPTDPNAVGIRAAIEKLSK